MSVESRAAGAAHPSPELGGGGLREGEGVGSRSLAVDWLGPAANFRYSIPIPIAISISMVQSAERRVVRG
ncbi:MAG: hypothetical protein RI897_2818, partial [Verrucomicrobiota bacterium]